VTDVKSRRYYRCWKLGLICEVTFAISDDGMIDGGFRNGLLVRG
jgi:hypothetical protein